MLNDRRRLVLKALVEEYIGSGQPVGSQCLVDRYQLGCSPATVRNELSALEETGHVYQPHVSAGRVPTDTGYRAFVDDLIEQGAVIPLAEQVELRRVQLALANEIDSIMRNTTAALSRLTRYVAVALAPSIDLARTRRIDLVWMGPRRALLVVITESGQVVSRQIGLAEDIAQSRLDDIESALNSRLDGMMADEVRPVREGRCDVFDGELVGGIMDHVIACLEEADRARLYHVGASELLCLPEFADARAAAPLVAALEDGLALLGAFQEVVRNRGVTVRIGSENAVSALGEMSLVATRYGSYPADGVVGVIGPTRMDYSRAIAAVHLVAEGLDEVLED